MEIYTRTTSTTNDLSFTVEKWEKIPFKKKLGPWFCASPLRQKANGTAVIIPIPSFPFKANSQVENTSEHYKNVRNLLPNIFIDRGNKNEIKDTSSVYYVVYREFVSPSLI